MRRYEGEGTRYERGGRKLVTNGERGLTHGGALGGNRPLRGFATLGDANTPSYARPSAPYREKVAIRSTSCERKYMRSE